MYLKFDEKIITDFSDKNVESLYNQGYVFGRVEKGYMSQTRSLRINLGHFDPTSENRRVLRKTENLILKTESLPYQNYSWEIGKLGKDFYDTKFGAGTFSANKIKELLTNEEKSNFNSLLTYSLPPTSLPVGYTICYQNTDILHYCYPFYSLELTRLAPSTGMGMMLKSILWAKENAKSFVYLGSFQRPSDVYKLQFRGLEWWGGKEWRTDLEELEKTV